MTDFDAASDSDLIQRCKEGESLAWSALVRRYERLIYTVARRAGLSDADCADVFQHCFVQLHAQLPRLAQPDRLQAWLVTTAKREVLRLHGLARRHVPLPSDGDDDDTGIAQLPDPAPLPPQQLESLQMQDRVWRGLKRLDARSRAFLECAFVRDPPMDYAELAQHFDIAPGSVGPTRARCLAKLRQALEAL